MAKLTEQASLVVRKNQIFEIGALGGLAQYRHALFKAGFLEEMREMGGRNGSAHEDFLDPEAAE